MNVAIKDRLAALGMSQAALARAVGLRPQAINKWVSGENRPDAQLWTVIEDALDWPRGHMLRLAGFTPPIDGGSLDPAVINQLAKVMKEVERLQALVEQAAAGSPRDPSPDDR